MYLYGNKNGNGARLEVANNVRKPEQDAFTGGKRQLLHVLGQKNTQRVIILAMDTVTIQQSYKHPTLCTVTVDGYGSQHGETTTSPPQPEHHWRLPNTDPRNEGKYLFRLHTLDIYFWKPEGAHSFIAAAKNKLQPDQLNVLDAPAAPAAHEQAMSPVVQRLESAAIRDPAPPPEQNRTSSVVSPGVTGLQDGTSQETGRQETPKTHEKAAFQPLAYNPAAPAAPEPIRHREKTPPPVDAEDGTGLAGAAYRDHTQAMPPQSSLSRPPYNQVPGSHGYTSPQPSQSHLSSFASPSPQPGNMNSQSSGQGHRASSVSSFAPPPPQSGQGSASPYTPASSFKPPSQSSQALVPGHCEQAAPSFSAPPQEQPPFYRRDTNPPESPATEILGTSYVSGVRQPLQHLQPQYANYTPSPSAQDQSEPIGGYSDYQYGQKQSQQHSHHQNPQSNEYDIHSQVYRPTLEEASKHKPSKASNAASASPTARLEQNSGKVDKKVNSFFKKLEKKIG